MKMIKKWLIPIIITLLIALFAVCCAKKQVEKTVQQDRILMEK
jgi:hypothetical protein